MFVRNGGGGGMCRLGMEEKIRCEGNGGVCWQGMEEVVECVFLGMEEEI